MPMSFSMKILEKRCSIVSNIYKYYVAYRPIRERELAREEAKKQLPRAQGK